MRIRYVAGTTRREARTRLRRLRGRVRRTPPCAAVVPRPAPAAHGTPTLQLSHVVLAADLHPSYIGLWPVAKRAWRGIAGVEPVLVLVAEAAAVPPDLAADADVRVFEPVPGLHTAFQAQCVRLLYPALLQHAEAVITSDIDMVPMGPRYFHRPLTRIDSRHFVCYRDVLLDLEEMPICYNAARPATWSSIFRVDDLDDVSSRLLEWNEGVQYAGTHGGRGWTVDQRQLYRTLLERGRHRRDVWILNDAFTGYRRLERAYVEKWGALSPQARRAIKREAFSDFHLVHADREHAQLNDLIVDAAVTAMRA